MLIGSGMVSRQLIDVIGRQVARGLTRLPLLRYKCQSVSEEVDRTRSHCPQCPRLCRDLRNLRRGHGGHHQITSATT